MIMVENFDNLSGLRFISPSPFFFSPTFDIFFSLPLIFIIHFSRSAPFKCTTWSLVSPLSRPAYFPFSTSFPSLLNLITHPLFSAHQTCTRSTWPTRTGSQANTVTWQCLICSSGKTRSKESSLSSLDFRSVSPFCRIFITLNQVRRGGRNARFREGYLLLKHTYYTW